VSTLLTNGTGTPALRRPRLCLRAVALSLLLAFLPAGACKHPPRSQSPTAPKDERSQPPAAAATASPPSPVPVIAQGPRFAVQVAAFERRPDAEALAARLSDQFGLQTLVAPVEANGQTFYRVRLLVKSKEEADSVADTFLRTENLKVWIVPFP